MLNSDETPAKLRSVSPTENSWCKAVPTGTGITLLSLLLKRKPNLSLLQTTLHKLLITHPILRSTLHYNSTTNTFSFNIPPSPTVHLHPFNLQSTAEIIQNHPTDPANTNVNVTPFQILLEHELNNNPWVDPDCSSVMVQASVYEIEGGKWAVMIRVHTGACDRTAAVGVLREMLALMGGGDMVVEGGDGEVNLGIEDYIPSGKTNKPFWARGMDLLGYSLNSFRFSNLDFVEPGLPKCSRVVRLLMDPDLTSKLLEGCRSREIKLCGVLSAAGLMAAQLSKGLSDGVWEKYAVVTLTDCRELLEPPLSTHHAGFYHSAVLNTHDIQGGEDLWDLARRTYTSFKDAKNSNKHFSDMADLNFLMCRAIENPGLTPSSSLRTSLISVFEDPVIEETSQKYEELGIEDYVGCASVHGVGPSIAIFDTIRDGRLDCACVYPSPLHSTQQMHELIDNMKKILVCCLDSSHS